MRKNIAIIDDHEIVRKGICNILNSTDHFKVVYEFSSNSKNEIWIFIVWAILFGGFTAVMLDS